MTGIYVSWPDAVAIVLGVHQYVSLRSSVARAPAFRFDITP